MCGCDGPRYFDLRNLGCHVEAEMHSRGAGRGVTYSGGHLRVLVSDADFGADAVAVAPRAAEANDQPVTRAGAYAFPKFRWRAQRTDHRIHAAVSVEVGQG